jgi:hypothetical protein
MCIGGVAKLGTIQGTTPRITPSKKSLYISFR